MNFLVAVINFIWNVKKFTLKIWLFGKMFVYLRRLKVKKITKQNFFKFQSIYC